MSTSRYLSPARVELGRATAYDLCCAVPREGPGLPSRVASSRWTRYSTGISERQRTSCDRKVDAAKYKNIVLWPVFLKYLADAFDERQVELHRLPKEPGCDLYIDASGDRRTAHVDRDFYTGTNVSGAADSSPVNTSVPRPTHPSTSATGRRAPGRRQAGSVQHPIAT